MDVINCIVVVIISISAFGILVKLFSNDDIRIISKSVILYSSILSMIIINLLLFYIYKVTVEYFTFSILNLYLALTAYIDKITMKVYRLSNIIFAIIGVILILCLPVQVENQITSAILYIVIVTIVSYTGGMGKGDVFTLVTIIPYMMFLNHGNGLLTIMLIDTVIFNILFIVINIRKINLKKMKLNSKSALTPSIAIGTMLIILIEGLFKFGI